ncbi:MAG: class I tRNA ligase family protein [Planctomycetota bacterium]
MAENMTLDTVYDPRAVEPEIYTRWEGSGAFAANPDGRSNDRTFTIVIPPPNVTGALHLGHALNNTLQDILIRYHRMRGFNTLWQPGTDHAGIATQAMVEKRIRAQDNLNRHDLGRETLVERIWQWKDEYEKRILSQLKLMGCSCDWGRTRFTLDEGLAHAVRRQFFDLFNAGFIFRGKRLVNWDTQLQTAVADDEVYYDTVKGFFWYFMYPIIDPKPGEPAYVLIATTRPETMLGDTAVAVCPNPAATLDRLEKKLQDDARSAAGKDQPEIERKLALIPARRESHLELLTQLSAMAKDGRKVLLPLVEREIPLIADDWADPLLGTGCVKITPAHDPNDYEVGIRHRLPMINVLAADGRIAPIIEPDGTTNPHSDEFAGLDFTGEGREKVVALLDSRDLLHAIEERDREVGHSDRSKHPIEPYLSDQWFVRTGESRKSSGDGLAQAAMDAVTGGDIKVFPSRYGKSYLDWLGEKRDWCISRQLWWGHRIPVWQKRVTLAGDDWRSLLPDISTTDVAMTLTHVDTGRVFGASTLDQAGDLAGDYDIHLCAVTDDSMRQFEQEGFVRDEDVLDTWFSSALWPFSTLGWPDDSPFLEQYYPGSVLCTSRDIITNWVARMVMFGLYSMDRKPFDHVYIHPKILDGRGETMSKSKGNGVDPVDIIHTSGADALRYTMADMCTETQDIRMPVEYLCPHCGHMTEQSLVVKAEEQRRKSRGEKLDRKIQPADCLRVTCSSKDCAKEFATQWAPDALKEELTVARETSEKFEVGRNFCNKLWNAGRFALMNLDGAPCNKLDTGSLAPEDRWILARLSQTIRNYHASLATYQFSASIREVRVFFWESLCDWYIELTKPRMALPAADPGGASARQVLAFCIDQVLRLLHPTIPFITEQLWQPLNQLAPRRGLPGVAEPAMNELLITAEFPPDDGYPQIEDQAVLDTFAGLQNATRGVRDLRTQCSVPPKQLVTATVVLAADRKAAFEANAHILRHMAGVENLTIATDATRPQNAGSVAVGGLRIFVHDISDDAAEIKRTTTALADVEKQIKGKEGKLGNEKFVANAKPEIVQAERERLAALKQQHEALSDHLVELQ